MIDHALIHGILEGIVPKLVHVSEIAFESWPEIATIGIPDWRAILDPTVVQIANKVRGSKVQIFMKHVKAL